MSTNIHSLKNAVVSRLKRQPHIQSLSAETRKGRQRCRKILHLSSREPIVPGAVVLAKNAAMTAGYTAPKPRKWKR